MIKKSVINKYKVVEKSENNLLDERCWERLEGVIRWQNMTINHFSDHIGLSAPERLYRIKHGKNGISRRLAALIVEVFPQINPAWLLTGRGEMFVDDELNVSQVSYYDVDVETNITNLAHLDPRALLTLPSGVDAECAMIYRGDAMGGAVPTNSVVMLKREGVESIIVGKEYVVVTKHFALLRVVRAGGRSGELRLVAEAGGRYDDIVVARDEVSDLYRVVAKLIVNY